ncbi:MAG: NAD(P)-dependent oxidoreductase [Ferruginibacter sp.]
MIVLNAEPNGYSEKAIESWKQKGYNYKASGWDEISNSSFFEDVYVLIVRLAKKIDETVLNKFPNLTHLVTATTGLDHINLVTVKARGIKLVSLKGHDDFLQTIPSTAELTWALLLALIRNIPAANEDVKQGNWDRDRFRGYQLKGKQLGIIGLGRTGKKVANYAKAFDMPVQYFDPYVTDGSFKKVDQLETLLGSSDIISLHIHLNEETQQLISERSLAHIKKDCLLINTSRGNVLDEEAVARALISKKIKGVATDVLSNELDDIRASPLWKAQQKNENIIITPHIGGASRDAMWACEEFVVEQL